MSDDKLRFTLERNYHAVEPDVPTTGHPADDMGGYVHPTWRDALANAAAGVPEAYERRRRWFQAAFNAGLTLRQIAEATGLSAAGVHKIIGTQRQASLDSEATGGGQ